MLSWVVQYLNAQRSRQDCSSMSSAFTLKLETHLSKQALAILRPSRLPRKREPCVKVVHDLGLEDDVVVRIGFLHEGLHGGKNTETNNSFHPLFPLLRVLPLPLPPLRPGLLLAPIRLHRLLLTDSHRPYHLHQVVVRQIELLQRPSRHLLVLLLSLRLVRPHLLHRHQPPRDQLR